MSRFMNAALLALTALVGCGSTGERVDPLRDLPRIDPVSYVQDRPTLRVVPCEPGASVVELFSGGNGGGADICLAAVERAFASSGAFRVRGDSDAIYELRLASMSLTGGGLSSVQIQGTLWDTAEGAQVGPDIEVEGAERKGDMFRSSDLLELGGLFLDGVPVHRINATQKALWKLVAKAQHQLR